MEDVVTETFEHMIEITVSEPHKIGDGMGSYIAYKYDLYFVFKYNLYPLIYAYFYRVSTRSSNPKFKKNQFSAMRRFSDFLGLHDILVDKYLRTGRIIPPAPQKNIIGERMWNNIGQIV